MAFRNLFEARARFILNVCGLYVGSVLGVGSVAQASPHLLPLFPSLEVSSEVPDDLPALVPLRAIPTIRVKIFPHLTPYPPQGLDARVDEAKLRAMSGQCRARDSQGKLVTAGVEISLRATGIHAPLRIECDGPATLERAPGQLSFAYEGAFLVKREMAGGRVVLQVVNEVPFETYLRGVVPIEMPSAWSEVALRVQAIAARTYAAYHFGQSRANGRVPDFDVDDTVYYQAYTGIQHWNPRTDDAVARTRGRVVTYRGQVIQAYFHAASGGHTEFPKYVWSDRGLFPYCIAKREVFPDDDIDPRWGPWTVSFTASQLEEKLRLAGLSTAANPVVDLTHRNDERTPSGRVHRITLHHRDGKSLRIDANLVRRALGLRSTLFNLSRSVAGSFEFRGRGYGHGVGMNQVGAWHLSESRGWDEETILRFYYTDVAIQPLPASEAAAM